MLIIIRVEFGNIRIVFEMECFDNFAILSVPIVDNLVVASR